MSFESIQQEGLLHFQNLLRINTTNPPGNEIEAIKYIASVLDREKISYEIFEPQKGRASLVARLPGNGSKKPLLLTGHVDVVPAEKEKWSVDPFAAEIKDGCVWGRGAVDMKHMVAMSLMMMLQAKRENLKLNRDLILACVADEEAGCEWGSKWLVENKPDLIRAEYALNEVGGFSLTLDDHIFYPIGVAERGFCWFEIIVEGDPGHGSLPHHNQANVKISKIVTDLFRKKFSFHKHPVVQEFVRELSTSQKPPKNWILKLLSVPFLNSFIVNKLMPDKKKARSFYAMYHNTVSPTVLRSGSKVNVIPGEASLLVDGRIVPGSTVNEFLEEIRKVIGLEAKIKTIHFRDPTVMEYKNDFFEMLGSVLKKHDPKAIPVPYLVPGFTDATYYKELGIKCYGFTPLKLPADLNFSDLFHGHNERLPVESFYFGLRVMEDLVRRI